MNDHQHGESRSLYERITIPTNQIRAWQRRFDDPTVFNDIESKLRRLTAQEQLTILRTLQRNTKQVPRSHDELDGDVLLAEVYNLHPHLGLEDYDTTELSYVPQRSGAAQRPSDSILIRNYCEKPSSPRGNPAMPDTYNATTASDNPTLLYWHNSP